MLIIINIISNVSRHECFVIKYHIHKSITVTVSCKLPYIFVRSYHEQLYKFQVSLTSTLANKKCHSRLGYHDPATFDLYSCAWCYDFLFSVNGKTLSASIHEPYLRETDQMIADYYLVPDITDNGNFSRICSTLTNDECKRWHACCMNAHDCCERQLSAPPVTNGTCARTWDGWGCWDDTPPSTSVYLSCPAYISFSIPTSKFSCYILYINSEKLMSYS